MIPDYAKRKCLEIQRCGKLLRDHYSGTLGGKNSSVFVPWFLILHCAFVKLIYF